MGQKKQTGGTTTLIGAVLVAAGVLFLLSGVFGLGRIVAGLLWPLWVIVPGLGLFALMVLIGRSSGWLAVPASVVTATGLLLFYANLFNHWRSWAYSWTLLFAAAGLGILISHYWSGRPQNTRFGVLLVQASLVGFVAFGLMFEVLFFSQGLVGRLLWPAVLILLGGYLLLRARDNRSGTRPRSGSKAATGGVKFEPLKKPHNDERAAIAEAERRKAR